MCAMVDLKPKVRNMAMDENSLEYQDLTSRIMLVEDEIIVALDIQQRLEILGYEVIAHATSSEEALAFAATKAPDLILMDIKIRGNLDGIQTAVQIRKSSDVPIIYLTAFADENSLKRARLTGAYGYLIKPFQDRELRSTMEMALYKYQIEERLRESEERYALAARAVNDGIWDWNLLKDKIYYSNRWAEMLGLQSEQVSNLPGEWLDRIHPDDKGQVRQALTAHISGTTPIFVCEYRIRHQDGGYRWMLCRGLALYNRQQQPYRMAGSQTDITDRKRFEQELLHKAFHDELTGLHNRALFTDRLDDVLDQKKRSSDINSVVLFLDLDNFKLVNDSFGHGWGDDILIQVAQRLESCLRPGDTIARFGGDEFAILLSFVEEINIAQQIADRILKQISLPFQVHDKEIFITVSVGMLQVNAGYQSTEEILRDVDTALYSAKGKGRARYEIFDQEMRARTLHHLDRAHEIRSALVRQEFVLHYQPIFTTSDQRLMGFEALIRWRHPTKGLILPGEFIALAEETRLIIPIGEWVLRTACHQAQKWNETSGKQLKISVNISRHQLVEEDFFTVLQTILEETGLAPQQLVLEITESAAMNDVNLTLLRLQQFHQIGVTVAIDDFGSGYSSMDYLKRFPANILKIDRCFINDMREDDVAIITAMVQMAHQLRLKTVAEGVETQNQLSVLVGLNCDEVQGYYLGKGTSEEEAWKLIFKDRSENE